MSHVIVVYCCWCFPWQSSEHLLGFMFFGCGSHLGDLKEQSGIHSGHSCEGWIVEESNGKKEKVWILPEICCTTFGLCQKNIILESIIAKKNWALVGALRPSELLHCEICANTLAPELWGKETKLNMVGNGWMLL